MEGGVDFGAEDAASGDAAALLEAMVAELTQWYGRVDGRGKPSATAADLSPPGGAYLVGRAGGVAIAGGGIKRLAEGTAEVKRMYVVPSHRGLGIARRLLEALEAKAAGLGYATVRLDTGAHQARAQGLYERMGYTPIPDYNHNPDACFWGEKQL